jgi:hypothetical protein
MFTTVQGTYHNGKIELTEQPHDMPEGTQVIITFVKSNNNNIDLASKGIDKEQAKALKANLVCFSDDWNSPEMNVYDNDDSSKSNH